MTLAVRRWSEADFDAAESAWSALLARSTADPLFMSWIWLHAWWEHHRELLRGEVCVLAVEADDGELVALAPLYRHRATVAPLLHSERLECLGAAWRDGRAAFSEYFDVIVDAHHRDASLAALAHHLSHELTWHDWALTCVRRDALVLQLAALIEARGALNRPVEALATHHIDLADGFEAWLGRLSANTRRRVFNQRAKLSRPEFRNVEARDLDDALNQLQIWRAARWESPRETSRDAFEHDLARRLDRAGALRLSVLSEDGKPLSVLFDVHVAGRRYYLASAFAPEQPNGRSPAYLHFGYAIDAACQEGAVSYDLLAGQGRHRDYKHDLATRNEALQSRHVVRGRLLKSLLKLRGAA